MNKSGNFFVDSINVLALDTKEYKNLFGSNYLITRVGGENGYYFVNKDEMKEEIKNPDGRFTDKVLPLSIGPNRSADTYIYLGDGCEPQSIDIGFYHPYRHDLEMIKQIFNKENNNTIERVDKLIGEIRVLPMYNKMSPNYSAGANIPDEKKTLFDIYQDNAINYVRNPDYFILDTDKLLNKEDNLIQKIDTLKDYIELLEKNPGIEGDFKKHFDAWRALKTWVNAPQESKKISKEQGVNYGATTELYKALFDKEAFEIMKNTAEEFYKQFYGEKGTELVNKYLDDLLNSKYPVMAYPLFPEPAYYYLKMFSDKFILPCVNELPDDSVAVFQSNSAFVEAYLCGMNTEMGRELLWREFPTDQRGSYFRKFWDSETSVKDILDDKYFDINSIHQWKGNLGENHDEAKEGLVLFTIKGKLMKQYPNTQVFLHRATQDGTIIDFDLGGNDEGRIKLPVIQAFLREDILMVGFKGEFIKLLGNPTGKDCGYILTFLQDVEDLNFEINNKGTDCTNAAEVASNLIITPTQFGKHLSLFI